MSEHKAPQLAEQAAVSSVFFVCILLRWRTKTNNEYEKTTYTNSFQVRKQTTSSNAELSFSSLTQPKRTWRSSAQYRARLSARAQTGGSRGCSGPDSGAALLSQPLDGRVFREPAHKSGVLVACGEALASAGNGDSRSAWPLGGAAGAAAGAKRKRCSDDGGTGAGE